jgi:hypothetical protein
VRKAFCVAIATRKTPKTFRRQDEARQSAIDLYMLRKLSYDSYVALPKKRYLVEIQLDKTWSLNIRRISQNSQLEG